MPRRGGAAVAPGLVRRQFARRPLDDALPPQRRWVNAVIGLAVAVGATARTAVLHAAVPVRPETAAHAGHMTHGAGAPARDAARRTRHPAPPPGHCTPDDCCGLCPGPCVPLALGAGPIVALVPAPLIQTAASSAPSATPAAGIFRYRQPLAIGPPASR